MDELALERLYRENLEERLIAGLAQAKGLPLERAMDVYYHSRMADMLEKGQYGIQYLDHKALLQMMLDGEPELFRQ